MGLGDALAWLDRHQNLERMLSDVRLAVPDLGRITTMVDILGHPERAAPVIHVTGTNGKTSTARAITALLMAKGLTVGTFTSPHLQRINERIAVNGQPISDDDLAAVLSDLAALEPLLGDDRRLTWFEAMTAAGLRHFADRPVDVTVLEVGLGGRWDATNVADAEVAVVTNIGWDHVELLGPTQADIAREKAGIIKADSTVVIGVTQPELRAVFEAEPAAARWVVGADYDCTRNVVAVGGRALDLRTPGGHYEGVWLALHGPHQAANFAAALAATEAFFGSPVEEPLVREAAATVRSPGRLEVVSRQPLVVLDGAKNVQAARAAVAALAEEFAGRQRILVVGLLRGNDPGEMLEALDAGGARLVVACSPPSPRAHPVEAVAEAARSFGVPVQTAGSVSEAVDIAVRDAGADDLVLVAGTLYVVGEARSAFAGRL